MLTIAGGIILAIIILWLSPILVPAVLIGAAIGLVMAMLAWMPFEWIAVCVFAAVIVWEWMK